MRIQYLAARARGLAIALVASMTVLMQGVAQADASINVDIRYEGDDFIVDFSGANWRDDVEAVVLSSCDSTDICVRELARITEYAGYSFRRSGAGLYKLEFRRNSTWWLLDFRDVLWEQFVANIPRPSADLAAAAERHAPLFSFHAREREGYFPVSLETLFGRPLEGFDVSGLGTVRLAHTCTSVILVCASAGTTASNFMTRNGHLGLKLFLSSGIAKTLRGSAEDFPVYWFAQKEGSTAWVTYSVFYAYDDKRAEYVAGPGLEGWGDHAIDRESVSVRFIQVDGTWYPREVVYAGHLPEQPNTFKGCLDWPACTSQGALNVRWPNGLTALPWVLAAKRGNRPIVYVADGSHAVLPAFGWYFLNVTGIGAPFNVTEPAGSSSDVEFKSGRLTLLDLNDSAHSALKFSGYLINAPGPTNYRVFPFVRFPIGLWAGPAEEDMEACVRTGDCGRYIHNLPLITDLTPPSAIVGRTTDFVLRGENLDPLSIGASNCAGLTTIASTAEMVLFSCTPERPGDMSLTLRRSATDEVLETRTVSVVAAVPAADCGAQSVTWTQGASTCNATYGGGRSGTTSLISDMATPTTGTATASCTNGVLSVTSPTCTTAPPPPPALIAPTSLAPSGTIASLTPVLSWSGGSGAANYEINVRDLTTNTIVLRQQGVSTASTSFTMPSGILVNTRQYRWDISACPTFACSSGYVTSGDLAFVTQVPSPPISVPDLIAQGISFAPTSVSTGGSTTISFRVVNSGPGAAAASKVAVRISASSVSSSPNDNVAELDVPLLAAGAGVNLSSSVSVTQPAGTYYVWVLADNRRTAGQSAAGEANDIVLAPGTLTVSSAPTATPDLIAQGVVFAPGTVTVGGMTLVTFSVTNTGAATSSASQAAVRITPAAATDPGSTNLGSVAIPGLAAGGSVVRTVGVTVPTAVGAYKAWVVADSNGAAGQSASAKANDSAAAALALTVVSRVTPLGGTAEGVYGGTMTGGPNPNFRMLVLEDGEFWSLYGVNVGGQLSAGGFIQGRATSGGGSFSASDVRDFGFFPAVTGGTITGTFDAAVGTLQGAVRFPGLTVNVVGGPVRDVPYEYNQPASLADFVGNWALVANTGDRISLNIAASGAMTATSAGGCSFTGTVAPRPSGKNVFNASLQFGASPCLLPGQRMTGVAVAHRRQDGRTQLTFAGVNAARTAGLMAAGTR